MAKLIDLTNQIFGKLRVIEKDNSKLTKTGSYWLCQCECGNYKSVRSQHLRDGSIQSCGCYRKSKLSELKIEDLTNQRFGMLVALQQSKERSNDNRVKWECICDCGNTVTVLAKDLKSLHTTSCGCNKKSRGEIEIEQILIDNNINFIPQYRFPDFHNRIYDFAIFDSNNQIIQLIEFDGEQHFQNIEFFKSSLIEQQKRDKEKDNYALQHNIPLKRISYIDKGKLTLDKIIFKEVKENNGL